MSLNMNSNIHSLPLNQNLPSAHVRTHTANVTECYTQHSTFCSIYFFYIFCIQTLYGGFKAPDNKDSAQYNLIICLVTFDIYVLILVKLFTPLNAFPL